MGSASLDEATLAFNKLKKLTAKHDVNWNDLSEIFAAAKTIAAEKANKKRTGAAETEPAAPSGPTAPPTVNVLGLVMRLIEEHIEVTAEQRLAIALWVLHTYVFHLYKVTPRLALTSPVRGCGKTALLKLLEFLVVNPDRSDNVTAASIYYDQKIRTLLFDEGDNLGLFKNPTLRAVLNSGHRRGGAITRLVEGRPRKLLTHMPLAVGAIGTLPLTFMQRSVEIGMRRATGQLKEIDEFDPAFSRARDLIGRWAGSCTLASSPETPLRNREADNWRILFAIADDQGYGEQARDAARVLCSNRSDEDPGVMLLLNIQTVFQALNVDRIPSAILIEELLGLEDDQWNDWRGLNNDQQPRKLTQGELARMLKPFKIRSRTVWPAQRRPGVKSKRGYYRSQFEEAWRAFCAPDASHSSAPQLRDYRSRAC
jgi:Protein of unknown function (DUF3631)